jgi:2'-5' RNA ligase
VRLFVAAYPPPDVRDDLAGLVGNLGVGQPRGPGRSVRLAAAENWHITLAFLGEVAEPQLDEVRSALDRAVEHWRAGTPGVPELRIAGGGTFGRRRFTTLWAGLRGDVDALGAVADAVRGELRSARLPYDNKPFRPHVTIARPGDRVSPEELAADLAALDGYEGPGWPVGDIRLMRSHLGPRPTYEVMHSVPLTP